MTSSFLSWLPGSTASFHMFITVSTVASVVTRHTSSAHGFDFLLYYYSFKNGKMPRILTEICQSPPTFSSHSCTLSVVLEGLSLRLLIAGFPSGAIFWHSLSLPEVQEQWKVCMLHQDPHIRLIGGFKTDLSKLFSFDF